MPWITKGCDVLSFLQFSECFDPAWLDECHLCCTLLLFWRWRCAGCGPETKNQPAPICVQNSSKSWSVRHHHRGYDMWRYRCCSWRHTWYGKINMSVLTILNFVKNGDKSNDGNHPNHFVQGFGPRQPDAWHRPKPVVSKDYLCVLFSSAWIWHGPMNGAWHHMYQPTPIRSSVFFVLQVRYLVR